MPADLNLHRNVREAYRQAMAQHTTQREAFQRAVDLLLEQEPCFDPASAGRVVAVMLANDPQLSAVFVASSLAAAPRGYDTQIVKFAGEADEVDGRAHNPVGDLEEHWRRDQRQADQGRIFQAAQSRGESEIAVSR